MKDAAGFKDAGSVHFVLIGQLGKYIEQLEDGSFSSAGITSEEILDDTFLVYFLHKLRAAGKAH